MKMNEVNRLRDEAINRASVLILSLKNNHNLTRKDIRHLACLEAKSTIQSFGILYEDFDLTSLQVQLLANKAAIAAMRTTF